MSCSPKNSKPRLVLKRSLKSGVQCQEIPRLDYSGLLQSRSMNSNWYYHSFVSSGENHLSAEMKGMIWANLFDFFSGCFSVNCLILISANCSNLWRVNFETCTVQSTKWFLINCLILLAICLIFVGNSMGEFQIRSGSPGSLFHTPLLIYK